MQKIVLATLGPEDTLFCICGWMAVGEESARLAAFDAHVEKDH